MEKERENSYFICIFRITDMRFRHISISRDQLINAKVLLGGGLEVNLGLASLEHLQLTIPQQMSHRNLRHLHHCLRRMSLNLVSIGPAA